MDRKCLLAIGAGALIRLVLFTAFPSLPTILAQRVEISTPVTSYKRLQEGIYLYTHGVSPYDGGVFHQAPLLLSLFSILPPSTIVTNLLYILADIFSAISLIRIASSGVPTVTPHHVSPRKANSWPPWAIAAAFLFNPFTIATCIARPTIVFTNTIILHSIAAAVKGRRGPAFVSMAMASYLSLYPALLLPPLLFLTYDSLKTTSKPSIQAFSAITTIMLSIVLMIYFKLSHMITGSWEFVASTYGVHLLLPDLTPNVGLWWYFFIEMFDSFRAFFLCLFQLHLLIYVPPVCLRLRKQPLFALITLIGISSIFKSYPAIGDTGLYLSLLMLYNHTFSLMRYTFFLAAAILYATFLGPAFYYLWVYAGSGNANFFYAITLVWSISNALIVADAIYAVLRDEHETERPELIGKDVVQI
ncbi:hypothetical protein TWF106_004458 [Orbilia oligospora]|uniref:GPI transamidase component n=1 Tax=Orbilia oligospora TaxID=2813651 RepID=A0A6G1LVE1_ORBOL|nr:hypothetical protein TWF788_005528 [Orbilia oligospora]KAF3197874.1 hypothetical protein TWF679_002560 [Orbilia oligospora]KAF3206019.1 hypothetical protein TWF191_001569 [Orbilia oligospora]KAF3224259.1 hypothetical protein TWF106_004458 [Orbilia oligospora]KAF3235710.1 hypothetical protein TWF192_000657 [Orbilia oligospora]